MQSLLRPAINKGTDTMKIIRSAGIGIIAGLIASVAVGCYRSPNTTWYEPHDYKGADDPLLSKLEQGGLHAQLDERVRAVQTDR